MTTPATPSAPNQAETPLSPEEYLKQAWGRYGNFIYLLFIAVALGILGKGGWDYLNAQKELGIQKEYSLCVTTDSFRAFAANHPGHPLTGAAELTVADYSYAAGKFAEALGAYTSAVADLPNGPIQDRARLGVAMSQALTGKAADAEANLRRLVNDTSVLKVIRCEAGYHLAMLAIGAGRGGEVQAIAEQLLKIDPESPFAERAFTLRPPVPEAVSVPAAPMLTLPAKP
jgi:hypothetical protein